MQISVFIKIKKLLPKYKTESLILLFVGFLSLLFTYNYINFSSSASVATGQVYTAKSIALSHNLDVDEYWGNSGADVINYNNHWYTPYAVLNPFIMGSFYLISQIPVYIYVHIIGPLNGTFSLIYESFSFSFPHTIALVFIGILIYLNLPKITINPRLKHLLVLGGILGTILFTYSVSFFNHIIASLFVLIAYTILVKDKFKFKYILVGVLIGLAFLTEFPTILFSISVFLYTIIKYINETKKLSFSEYIKKYFPSLLMVAIPVTIFIAIQLFINKSSFGNYFLFGESIYNKSQLEIGKTPSTFSQNPLFGLYGMYLSPLKGLFVYSPFLLFSILGFKKFYKQDKIKFYTAFSYIVIISLLYSTWSDCFGATTVGTRYMVSIIPFITIFAGYSLFKVEQSKILKGIFITLSIYSIVTILLVTSVGIASYTMGQCENINLFGPNVKLKVAKDFIINKKYSELAPVLLNAK